MPKYFLALMFFGPTCFSQFFCTIYFLDNNVILIEICFALKFDFDKKVFATIILPFNLFV